MYIFKINKKTRKISIFIFLEQLNKSVKFNQIKNIDKIYENFLPLNIEKLEIENNGGKDLN